MSHASFSSCSYIVGLEEMSPYNYEEKPAGPFPDAWTRYCIRFEAYPIFIYKDTLEGKIKIGRTDLYREYRQQREMRKKLIFVHDKANEARIAKDLPWELLEEEVIDRRKVTQRRIRNG